MFRRFSISLLVLSTVSGVADAKKLEVPDEHATIQSAIASAQPNDTIEIEAGTYLGSIYVPASKAGLRIVGKGKVILDFGSNGTLGGGLRIAADDVEVKNLTVRLARDGASGDAEGVNIEGDRARVEKLTAYSNDWHGLRIAGDDAHVKDSKFAAGQFGVGIYGDDAVIEDCTASGAVGTGFYVWGDRAVIRDNVSRNCSEGASILGDDGLIDDCRSENGAYGFHIEGDNGRIRSSKVAGWSSYGIQINGQNPLVKGNELERCSSDTKGIFVRGCTFGKIEENEITDSLGPAIHVDGNGVRCKENEIRRCGYATTDVDEHYAAFAVTGNGNELIDNVVRDCPATAIYVEGNGNLLTGNALKKNRNDGIHIASGVGNRLVDNSVRKSVAEGIQNWGAATDLLGNELKNNRLDIANDGSISEFEGNEYETGGPQTPTQVDPPA